MERADHVPLRGRSVARVCQLTAFDRRRARVRGSRRTLAAGLVRPLPKMAAGGVIWIAWPKKASGVVTEDTMREIALPMGIVDVKVCAIDATWSGLKLLRRRA